MAQTQCSSCWSYMNDGRLGTVSLHRGSLIAPEQRNTEPSVSQYPIIWVCTTILLSSAHRVNATTMQQIPEKDHVAERAENQASVAGPDHAGNAIGRGRKKGGTYPATSEGFLCWRKQGSGLAGEKRALICRKRQLFDIVAIDAHTMCIGGM